MIVINIRLCIPEDNFLYKILYVQQKGRDFQ